MVSSTAAMGGVVAWATGGDFLQGAMQGMNIGFLNHAMHDDPPSVSTQQEDQNLQNMLLILFSRKFISHHKFI